MPKARRKGCQIRSCCGKVRLSLRRNFSKDCSSVIPPDARRNACLPLFVIPKRSEESPRPLSLARGSLHFTTFRVRDDVRGGSISTKRRTSPKGAKLGRAPFFRHSEAKRGIPSQGMGCKKRGDPSHAPSVRFGMTCKTARRSAVPEVSKRALPKYKSTAASPRRCLLRDAG